MCQLKNLRFLDFCSNLLSEVSSDINNLEFLETLLIMNNRLKNLPECIGELKCLKTLWISGNYITKLPFDACQLDVQL